MGKNIDYLISETKKFEYISFDIFDTLLFRNVGDYKDIFYFVEEKYNQQFSDKISNFRAARIIAEQKARNEGQRDDITLDDIYDRLSYPNYIKNRLKKIELQSEFKSVFPNTIMVDFLLSCKKNGKKIIIATDMYLPKCIIYEMLKKCGIHKEYIDNIFISGEIGLSKYSGRLFHYILNTLKINSDSICHIGDNKISDIKRPKDYGIKSFFRVYNLPIKVYGEGTSNWKLNYIVKLAQSNYLNCIPTSPYRIAYSAMGPFIISFCNWLKTISEKGGTIGFVAREGYLLKKCYDLLYPEQNTLYVRYNKNVLRLPMLYLNPTIECFLKTIPYRDYYSKNELYTLLHIDNISKIEQINKWTPFNRVQRSDMYGEEFSSWFIKILNIIHEETEEQYMALTQELILLSKITNKVLLVNNSLNGNAQSMLNIICKKSTINLTFCGVQFIATRKCKDTLKENLHVFFDDSNIDNTYKRIFANYSLLIEHLMFEECGSAKIIKRSNSRPIYILDDMGIEVKNHNIIMSIQDSIILYVKQWKANEFDIKPTVGVDLLIKFLSDPFRDDVEYLMHLYDEDFFGVSMIIEASVIGERNIIKKVKNIRDYDKVKWLDGLIKIDSSYRFIGEVFKSYKSLIDKEKY